MIVFFRTKSILDLFYQSSKCEVWKAEKRIQILEPQLTEHEKKNKNPSSYKTKHELLWQLKNFGRGIDFKVFDDALRRKGLHVELTYWPVTKAEETQIKGRTAKQGDYGSFHILLNKQTMIESYSEFKVDEKKKLKKS